MKKCIWVIFLLMVLSFIFYMSSQNAIKSNNYNLEVVNIIRTRCEIDLYSLFGNGYIDIIIRKLGHFFEFSILSAAVYLVLYAFKVRRITLLTILFCIFLGFTDEFHQFYVPGRSFSLIDVSIDSLGILTTISGISLLRMIKIELFNVEDDYGVRNSRGMIK